MRYKSIAFIATVGLMSAVPLVVESHNISGAVKVNCDAKTVSVTVTNWSGNVEITKLPDGPITEKAPSTSNSTVVFSIASIGGNGNYTAGRQNNPNDPKPVNFTVDCLSPHPTPSPTPSPTPKPTPSASVKPSPESTPTPAPSSTPTPMPTQSVAPAVVPELPAAGHPPE